MNQLDLQAMAQREQQKQAAFRCRILCCASTPCLSSGGTTVQQRIADIVKERNLEADIQIVPTGCMGPCSRGPMVTLEITGEAPIVYERVTTDAAVALVERHLSSIESLPDKVMPSDLPFFARQMKIVLANSGRIDPERMEDAVAHDAYTALAKALHEMTPEEVCQQLMASGLRGRDRKSVV